MNARNVTALGLAALATLMLFAALAAMKPAKADAWAWRDDCTAIIYNRTGAQSSVHPVSYIPVLPNPGSIAAFAAYAIVGIPVNQALPLVNTGYPAPAYGCHAIVATTSPSGATSCAYSAPTTGANHFDCSDNVSFRIIKDDDDIAANVFIPRGSGPSSPPLTAKRPRNGGPALRPGALPGKGWRSSHRFAHLGLISRLMNTGSLPSSCQRGGHHAPNVERSTQLLHRRGERGVGAVATTYDTAKRAHQVTASVLSKHSIHCLSRLLTSSKLHTKVQVQPLATGGLGGGARGKALVIHRRIHGEHRKAAYYEVVTADNGRKSGVVMFQSAHRPVGAGVFSAAVEGILNRIGA